MKQYSKLSLLIIHLINVSVLFSQNEWGKMNFPEETFATSPSGIDRTVILDGDPTTSWTSPHSGVDVTIHLVYPWPIKSIDILWGEKFPSEYTIESSVDGKMWSELIHRTGFKGAPVITSPGGWKREFESDIVNPMVTASYLRLRTVNTKKPIQIKDVRINGQYAFCYAPIPKTAVCFDKTASLDARVNDMLSRMTVREKIGLTGGFNYYSISGLERFGFHEVMMCDASAGLHIRPVENEFGITALSKSTSFPATVALAATWDPTLAFALGKSIGEECRAAGVGVLLGPGMNIYRTSTCGRNFEYMGEDPYLVSRMVVQDIKGIQSQGIMATAKHLMANQNEFGRYNGNAIIDARTMREIYLVAFNAAIKEADVAAIMSSYNWLNNEKCGDSKTLLTDVLRKEMGYDGMVMSDWGGFYDFSKTLESGQNLIMPAYKSFHDVITSRLISNYDATVVKLNSMVAPTVKALLKSGVWERVQGGEAIYQKTLPEHQIVSLKIAESAITLLKNDQVLPLKIGQKILIVGNQTAVKNSHSGIGSGYVEGWEKKDFFVGLKAIYGDNVSYEEKPTDAQIAKADRILYFFNMLDAETYDRSFELPEETNTAIKDLASKNKNVIVIASTGTAFGMPWINSVKGLVHGYYLGQEYGTAMANVLSGAVNPSGKLPFSMEQSFADSPAFDYNIYSGQACFNGDIPATPFFNINYKEGVLVGYRWYDTKKKQVNFPFGFGLSYTTFKYKKLSVKENNDNQYPFTAIVSVTNTGAVAGKEVVQVYVSDVASKTIQPEKRLAGFLKIDLKPGETKTVSIPLNFIGFKYVDSTTNKWVFEAGDFIIKAGSSSRTLTLSQTINITTLQ